MRDSKRDTDVKNRLLDSVGKGEGGMIWENSTEACILSRVKQITSPGWMHETSARGWCTGMTQRDGMGREVGGDSGWGTLVHTWLIHVSVWQQPPEYCKVISLQLKKLINLKKRQAPVFNALTHCMWFHCCRYIAFHLCHTVFKSELYLKNKKFWHLKL